MYCCCATLLYNGSLYLRFQDWLAPIFLGMLNKKGLPHDGKIIKVYGTEFDPRVR